jgi:hypothetical protein
MSVYSQKESNIATGVNTPAPPAQEKSLGELFGDLTREATDLVRQEVQLAKTEMTQKAAKVGKDAGMIAAGGFVAYIGALALAAALIIGLGKLIGYGWSALLVGIVFVAIGAMVAMQGLAALKRVDPVPHQTIESIKELKNG